jgi:hypothetical protein
VARLSGPGKGVRERLGRIESIEDIAGVLRMSLDGLLTLWWVSIVLVALATLAVGGLVRRKTSPRFAIAVLIISAPV